MFVSYKPRNFITNTGSNRGLYHMDKVGNNKDPKLILSLELQI